MLATANAPVWGQGTMDPSSVSRASTSVLRTLGPQHQHGRVGCLAVPHARMGCKAARTLNPRASLWRAGSPVASPRPTHCGVPVPALHQLPSGMPAPAEWHVYISSAHLHLFTYFRGKLPGFMMPDRLPRAYH